MKYVISLFGALLLIILIYSFRGKEAKTNEILTASSVTNIAVLSSDSLPTRRQLRRSYFEKREILVVYGTEDKILKTKYEDLLSKLAEQAKANRRGSINVQYTSIDALQEKDIHNQILFLIGTAKANPLIKRLTRRLPLTFDPSGLNFNNNQFSTTEDILSITFYPNPENRQLPFSFVTGNDDDAIYDFFERANVNAFFRWQSLDYEITRENKRILMGNFDVHWKPDPKVYFNYAIGNDLVYQSTHYDFISHQNAIDETTLKKVVTQVETSTDELLHFIGNTDLPLLNYHIYKTAEDKGLMLGNTAQAHIDTENLSVYTIINDKYKDNFVQKELALIVDQKLGEAKAKVFQRGLPVYFTTQWQRKGYRYWAAHLSKSGNALSMKELFDNELIEKESPLMVDCFSAMVTQFFIERWGKTKFLERYNSWIPSSIELKTLEKDWNNWLVNQTAETKLIKRQKSELGYLKGFNFAHEGYSIYNGYLSRKATEAIEKQKALGSNAIAVVPYSYIRSESKPTYMNIGSRAGSENDQGVVHSAYEAKQLGIHTLLKPQVFFGSSWPGALNYETEEDWEAFFDYYYRWIRHYAFLAEIHQIDALCMGVEFSIATLTHGEQWKNMFQKVRGLYQGQLTYAANWGEEFEQLDFWDELDFIGLNSYYPLSKEDNPSDDDLKASFDRVKEKITKVYNKYQKPIVFTEIGFRSIDMPWKNPHADGDTSFNPEHQQRCYEVIFEGIQNEPWCSGILWWKFPSYLEYRGIENNAFTPNNKVTEETVKEWFSNMKTE